MVTCIIGSNYKKAIEYTCTSILVYKEENCNWYSEINTYILTNSLVPLVTRTKSRECWENSLIMDISPLLPQLRTIILFVTQMLYELVIMHNVLY